MVTFSFSVRFPVNSANSFSRRETVTGFSSIPVISLASASEPAAELSPYVKKSAIAQTLTQAHTHKNTHKRFLGS